jgi:hypothetical protein
MEIITSKKCSACREMLPISDFRFKAKKMRYESACRACESDQAMDRQRRAREASAEWSPQEIAVLHERYEAGGTAACLSYLPGRRRSQVQSKARREGLVYEGPVVSGSPMKEGAWCVPAHDYTEADIALRGWRAAMPMVGAFSPSVGLVMGGGVL